MLSLKLDHLSDFLVPASTPVEPNPTSENLITLLLIIIYDYHELSLLGLQNS